jgi:peptidoglycan/LPS O-acetylase OafA/YrhL
MEKNIRSYLNSLIIIFIFYFATRGIVKLLWNHNNREVVKARTFILFASLFIGSFLYIVITYHLVDGKTEMVHFFYKIYLILAFLYIVVGLIYDIVSTSNLTSKKTIKNENK